MRKTIAIIAMVSFGFASTEARASWLSEITGIEIDVPNMTVRVNPPNPGAIPEMLENLPQDVGQALLNPGGNALAFAIRASKNTAGGGSQPIPPDIRSQLTPFFPQNILNVVRYNTNKASLSLPAAINLINEGNTVTLDNLIVFTDSEAASDPIFWAHELTHVMQYQNMGVEGFANVYFLTGGSDLESQARDVENRVASALQYSSHTNNQNMNYQMSAGAFNSQLSIGQMQQQAQIYYPPGNCGQWQGFPGGANVYNSCPVPIMVTSFGLAGPFGPIIVPCNFNCVVYPGITMPFTGAQGQVIGFTFVY